MARRPDGTRIHTEYSKAIRGLKQNARRRGIPLRKLMQEQAEADNDHALEWFANKADANRRLYQRPKAGQNKRATVKKSWHQKKEG